MSWMAPASETLALRVGGEFALLLYKGVRSVRKGSAELGAHGSADTDVSALLRAWSYGDQDALQALTPIVYEELHRLARDYMRRERSGHSLQATALRCRAARAAGSGPGGVMFAVSVRTWASMTRSHSAICRSQAS
jgi:ECF sigma factor